jgi:hypothetical protein
MEIKITLCFDESIIKAGRYVKANKVKSSQLIEFLLQKVTALESVSMEDYPISAWVNQLAEGPIVYQAQQKSRKISTAEYYKSRR